MSERQGDSETLLQKQELSPVVLQLHQKANQVLIKYPLITTHSPRIAALRPLSRCAMRCLSERRMPIRDVADRRQRHNIVQSAGVTTPDAWIQTSDRRYAHGQH